MKLYRLTLRGIGPFRDRVDINFEALADGGLFLIEGATGSGKSTIIDSIAYALYGSVLGAGSDFRMTSDFRDDSDPEPPFIEMVFETAQGLWRVRREPEFTRSTLKNPIKATASWYAISADQIDTPANELGKRPCR